MRAAVELLGRDEIEAFIYDEDTPDLDIKLWEIAENLHRADLSVLERSEQVDAWIRLADDKATAVASCDSSLKDGRRKGPQHRPRGIRAAADKLGIDKDDAHRAVKVASLSPAAKQAAKAHGQDDNRGVLLAAAKHKEPERQVAELKRIAAAPAPMAIINCDSHFPSGLSDRLGAEPCRPPCPAMTAPRS